MTQKTQDQAEIEKLKSEIERLQATLAAIQAEQNDTATHASFSREDFDQIGEKVQEGVHDLQRQIEANPVPSAMMAFVLGFLISRVFQR